MVLRQGQGAALVQRKEHRVSPDSADERDCYQLDLHRCLFLDVLRKERLDGASDSGPPVFLNLSTAKAGGFTSCFGKHGILGLKGEKEQRNTEYFGKNAETAKKRQQPTACDDTHFFSCRVVICTACHKALSNQESVFLVPAVRINAASEDSSLFFIHDGPGFGKTG